MALMTLDNVFQDAVNAAVRAEFTGVRDSILNDMEGRELFTTYEVDTANDTLQRMDGPGYATLTIEGQKFGSNELWRDYPKAAQLRYYTSELQFTKQDLHFLKKMVAQKNDLKGQLRISDAVSSAIDPVAGVMQKDLAKMIYLSLGTTFFTGGDAKALVASDHPIRKSGSTQSNTATAAFAPTALVTGLNAMNRFQNMAAVQLKRVTNFALVGGVGMESKFDEVLESMYGPYNALLGEQPSSRAAMRRRGIRQVQKIILGEIPSAYDNYWWIVDLDRAKNRLFNCIGWQPNLEEERQKSYGTLSYLSDVYFGPSALGWQFIYGSTGAA